MEKRRERLRTITEGLRTSVEWLHTFLRTYAFAGKFASKRGEKWQKE